MSKRIEFDNIHNEASRRELKKAQREIDFSERIFFKKNEQNIKRLESDISNLNKKMLATKKNVYDVMDIADKKSRRLKKRFIESADDNTGKQTDVGERGIFILDDELFPMSRNDYYVEIKNNDGGRVREKLISVITSYIETYLLGVYFDSFSSADMIQKEDVPSYDKLAEMERGVFDYVDEDEANIADALDDIDAEDKIGRIAAQIGAVNAMNHSTEDNESIKRLDVLRMPYLEETEPNSRSQRGIDAFAQRHVLSRILGNILNAVKSGNNINPKVHTQFDNALAIKINLGSLWDEGFIADLEENIIDSLGYLSENLAFEEKEFVLDDTQRTSSGEMNFIDKLEIALKKEHVVISQRFSKFSQELSELSFINEDGKKHELDSEDINILFSSDTQKKLEQFKSRMDGVFFDLTFEINFFFHIVLEPSFRQSVKPSTSIKNATEKNNADLYLFSFADINIL